MIDLESLQASKKSDWDDNYDWLEVFAYADGTNEQQDPADLISLDGATTTPFSVADVVEILGAAEGERDEANWLVVGKLRDGRYFFIDAGCDYTGWDCRAGGTVWVALDWTKLAALGLGDEARKRLGFEQQGETK